MMAGWQPLQPTTVHPGIPAGNGGYEVLSLSLQDDLVSGLDFGELNITSQDDDILDEAAGGATMADCLYALRVFYSNISVVLCAVQ